MNEVTKTIRMPRKMLDTWLAALRSGDYKQGKNALYNPITKGYCCLGVLEACLNDGKVDSDGKLMSPAAIVEKFELLSEEAGDYDYDHEDYIDGAVSCYPNVERLDPRIQWISKKDNYYKGKITTTLTDWLSSDNRDGLKFNPIVFTDTIYGQGVLDKPQLVWVHVAELNDSADFTFEQIADLVEAHTEVIDDE